MTNPKFNHADRIRLMQQLGAAVASGAEISFNTEALRHVYDLVQDASILASAKELELIGAGHVTVDMEQIKYQVSAQLLEAGWSPPGRVAMLRSIALDRMTVAELEATLDGVEEVPTIDLDQRMWNEIKQAASDAKWMPPEYTMNDWVADIRNWLRDPTVIEVHPWKPALEATVKAQGEEIERLKSERGYALPTDDIFKGLRGLGHDGAVRVIEEASKQAGIDKLPGEFHPLGLNLLHRCIDIAHRRGALDREKALTVDPENPPISMDQMPTRVQAAALI